MLRQLREQASDLEQLLSQLNAAEANLDEALLAPPAPAATPEDREARRAKRAVKRAARKATGAPEPAPQAAAAAVSSSPASSTARAAARPATSTSSPASSLSSSSSTTHAPPSVQHLEELFKLTADEPDLPSSSAAAPARASLLTPKKLAPRRPAVAPPPPVPRVPAPPPQPAAAPAAPMQEEVQRQPPMAAPQQPQAAAVVSPSPSAQAAVSPAPPAPRAKPQPVQPQAQATAASILDTSAQASRGAGQLSVMQAGPSLLSLAPSHASPSSARGGRASARRSQAYSRAAQAQAVLDVAEAGNSRLASDGISQLLGHAPTGNMDVDMEREVTEVVRDFLLLEKVRRQCHKTLGRAPSADELAKAVGMDTKGFTERYEAGLRAKELLLKTNYKLVMTVCKGYMGKGPSLQDLIAEGLRGLLRGVEKYDASKGFRFSTYAHWWIRQAISRSLTEQGRIVRLPVHMIEQYMKVKAATASLRTELGREPTLEELAGATSLDTERIEVLLEAAQVTNSLDTSVNDDDNATSFKDMVEDAGPSADQVFLTDSMRADLDVLISSLSEREADVVRLRFGLEDGREWTLEEIGERLAVTRERIRQIEAKALRKLKVMTVADDGVLKEYGDNFATLDSKDMAARTSSGLKKSS